MSFVRKVSIALVAVFALNAAQAAEIKLPEFQSITLDNGATVLLMPRKDVPLVAANIAVRGGALADPIGKEGVATSMLRPAGRGRFGDKTFQVVSLSEYIEEGTPIVIVQAEGNRYVVDRVKKPA